MCPDRKHLARPFKNDGWFKIRAVIGRIALSTACGGAVGRQGDSWWAT